MAKRRPSRPRVTVNCVADQYASDGERIIEFSDGEVGLGGLISLGMTPEGKLRVFIYRIDEDVEVIVSRRG